MLPDEFGFFRKNMHKYTNETPTSKSLINNIKGFGASFQKVRKTGHDVKFFSEMFSDSLLFWPISSRIYPDPYRMLNCKRFC